MEAALGRWLQAQRWFAGKNQSVRDVTVTSTATLVPAPAHDGPEARLLIVAAEMSDGTVQRYQVPVGVRTSVPSWLCADPIAVIDGRLVYEATSDPELMSLLLQRVATGRSSGPVRFRSEREGALQLAVRAGLGVRPLQAEQSNSSVVFGERFILKLFRRAVAGTNPDLDVLRRIGGEAGAPIAPVLGSIEGDTELGPVTLGLVQSFVPGAVDGWTLATAAADGAELAPEDFAALGAAVRSIHRALARAFGSAALTPSAARRLTAGMSVRLEEALEQVPVLRPFEPSLRASLAVELHGPLSGRLQRVHGDLHLGQVLRTGDGWLLIDFEGEPSASPAERVAWRSPLQDVAGMLRSIDYAARTRREDGPGWAEGASDAFLRGYGGITSADWRLLRAFELDKAVYEVLYETRNRPNWVSVPLGAVRDLTLGQQDAGAAP